MMGLLGQFIDKEKVIKDQIKDSLVTLSQELNCDYKGLCVIIMPTNEEMDFEFWLCKNTLTGPEPQRIVPLKEILD